MAEGEFSWRAEERHEVTCRCRQTPGRI